MKNGEDVVGREHHAFGHSLNSLRVRPTPRKPFHAEPPRLMVSPRKTTRGTALYWKGHLVKARIDLAQGKKQHDKRESEKDRDWQRQKARIVRDNVKQ